MSIEYLSAVQLGKLVNKKEISCREVLEFFKDRIEKRNPSINAFVYTKFDEAFECADNIQNKIMKGEYAGPFAGVPFGLKDFLPSKKGWTASHGGVKCYQTVDVHDSEFCAAAERLGGIAIGKTNAPAFGFRATTDNKMYGPTSTPFKVGYNSGGSSGGSCAAVADGLVPMSETGDAGGSTRCPASWCGCFGFKQSAGLVPSVCRPDAWTATHPYCCGSAATRTVLDSAYILDEMKRYDQRDPISVKITDSMVDAVRYHYYDYKKTLKIGFTYNFDLFAYPEKEIADAITDTAKMLDAEPVEFKFKHSISDMEEAWLHGINLDDAMSSKVDELVERYPEDFPEAFLKWNKIAKETTLNDYKKFHRVRTDILDAHCDILDKYDIIIAPVTGCLPVKNSDNFDTKGPNMISGQSVDPLIGFSYTYLENMIGTPAASIPSKVSKEGLPIGVQIIGRRYEDAKVFAVCRMLEDMNPWNYDIPASRI